MDPETRKEIERVEHTLEEIRNNTSAPWWRAAVNGAFYGSGAVVGTVIAIALLGWLLSLFGIVPGFAQIANKLQQIMNSKF